MRLAAPLSAHSQLAAFLIYSSIASAYAVVTNGVLRDDAYIFFSYARNIAHSATLSFNPGETTFGVTSIAWTVLLALGTRLIPDPILVAKAFGVILGAGGTVLLARWICRRLDHRFSIAAVAFAALLPNIGADRMVTGMETGLLCFLYGVFLNVYSSEIKTRFWIVGAISGLLFLTRPELTLALVPVLLLISLRENMRAAVKVAAGAAAAALWPVFLFIRTGSIFPPTMRGKLSVFLPEHLGITIGQFHAGGITDRLKWAAIALIKFIPSGISELSFFLLLGATVIGALWMLRSGWTKKAAVLTLFPAVAIAYIALYSLAFPLLQLRYFTWLVPPLALLFYLSLSNMIPARFARKAQVSAIILCLVLQPFAMARRVDSTEVQQVRRAVGETIWSMTSDGARIALEPIGEIGYYANRYIVDMGGITDARIQPYLADGYADVNAVWKCLTDLGADYLVTYDNDGFLGRMPRDLPERFEHVAYIPEQPVRGIRYRFLRIVKD